MNNKRTNILYAMMVIALLLTSYGFAGDWELLLENLPFTGTEIDTVAFQTHDNILTIDYVVVTEPNSNVLFEDYFDGTAGTAPDPNKWTVTSDTSDFAVQNGLGQVVLTPGPGVWASVLKTKNSATTWTKAYEPTVEFCLIFPESNGSPEQAPAGFGTMPMYDNRQCFYPYDDDILYVQWIPGGGITATDTGRTVIRDGATPQYFRITRHPDGTADYWGKDLGAGPCTPPKGDISGPGGVPDCKVDLIDFSIFAGHWLEDTN